MNSKTKKKCVIEISYTTREELKDIMTKRDTYDSMILNWVEKEKKKNKKEVKQ